MNEDISFMPVIDHPGWANIKDSSELLQKSATLFALSLVPAVRRAVAAMSEFGDQMRRVKEREALKYFASMPDKMSYGRFGKEFSDQIRQVKENAYLQHHERLPGSSSTARLRKKREDIVDCWYFHYDH